MTNEEQAPRQPEPEKAEKQEKGVEMTVLRPYPKIVFFYLTWIAALVCGIATSLYEGGPKQEGVREFWTYIFLVVFTFNLLVVAFEFGRMLTVSLVFFTLALIFLGAWANFLGDVFSFLGEITPAANPQFFFFVFVAFTIIYLLVFVQTRFNYWVVRRNELLHKHGFLGDVKRYNAQNIKINKEIPDVLEFLLLRSGSFVVHPEQEDRAFVLDNIIGINRKEREVKEILESYAVRIDKD